MVRGGGGVGYTNGNTSSVDLSARPHTPSELTEKGPSQRRYRKHPPPKFRPQCPPFASLRHPETPPIIKASKDRNGNLKVL